MDSKNFLDKMREIGNKYGKQGGAGFITQIKIEFGFYAYGGPEHDRLKFWKRCEDQSEAEIIKAEIQDRLDQAGVSEKPDFCLHIFANGNCLGRVPKGFDDNLFIPKWQWDKKEDGIETCASLIFDSIEENKLPFGDLFWGKYQLRSNPYHVNLGESGKKESKKDGLMYWPNFVLPVEKYSSEEEARVAASGSQTTTSNNDSEWSDRLNTNHPDPSKFLSDNGEDIVQMYNQIKDTGEKPYSGAPDLPAGPVTLPKIKMYLAQDDLYACDTEDIDIVLNSTIISF